jgi:crotonobetainyl-CoA:carnitine CoA-transferase CaiB-like acyl-CoA transferase
MTRFVAGPYCTMLLADQGAEVVKVEPIGGEETRSLPPMVGLDGDEGVSAYFLRFNRSKKSICLDLKSDEGRRVFRALLEHADVLVENFRPGVLERMGFGWSELSALNERLIYCTITGFGHTESELRDRAAFTPIVEAMAGALIYSSRDRPPSIAGYPVGDIFPAGLACGAIALALYRRERDGRGARVDMAMYDAMVAMNERAVGMSAMLGSEILPGIPADLGSAPSGVFSASDGFMSISVVGEGIWRRFCEALGRDDWAADDRLQTGPGRAEHYETIIRPGIQQWLEGRPRGEAVRLLTAAGVPAAVAATPSEVARDEHARKRGMVIEFPTKSERGVPATVTGNPMQLADETPARVGPAPMPGEHTVDVLRAWAGFSDEEIEGLLSANVVGRGAA